MIREALNNMSRFATTTVQPSVLIPFVALAMILVPATFSPIFIVGLAVYCLLTFLVTSSYVVWLHHGNQLRMPIQQLNKLVIRSYIVMTLLPITMITITAVVYNARPPLWITAILFVANAAVTLYMLLPIRYSLPLVASVILLFAIYRSISDSSPLSSTAPLTSLCLALIATTIYFFAWVRWKTIRSHDYSKPIGANKLSEVAAIVINSTSSDKTFAQWYAILPAMLVPRFDPIKPRNARQRISVMMGPLFANTLGRNPTLWWMTIFMALFYLFIVLTERPHYSGFGIIVLQWMMIPDFSVERGLYAFLARQPQDVAELLLLPGLGDAKQKLQVLIGLLSATTLKIIAILASITLFADLFSIQPLSWVLMLIAIASLSSLITTITHCLFTLTKSGRRSRLIDRSTAHRGIQLQAWGMALIFPGLITLQLLFHSRDHTLDTLGGYLWSAAFIITLTTYILLGYRWYRRIRALPHPFVEING